MGITLAVTFARGQRLGYQLSLVIAVLYLLLVSGHFNVDKYPQQFIATRLQQVDTSHIQPLISTPPPQCDNKCPPNTLTLPTYTMLTALTPTPSHIIFSSPGHIHFLSHFPAVKVSVSFMFFSLNLKLQFSQFSSDAHQLHATTLHHFTI